MCRHVFFFLLWILAFPGGAAPRLSAEDELASQADSRLFSRGEYLARAADCAACHTASPNAPFAGGVGLATPLGAVYSTNITPDPKTGIGNYSFEDFDRAVRQGIAKGGRRLYPAMPYPSYAKLSEDDVRALYTYFLQGGVDAIARESRESDIPWPLDMRWPLAVWNWLFLDENRFEPRTDKSERWNRGAYLVQALAHCGTCHTPRGFAFQEVALDERQEGFLAGGSLGGWDAYNITSHPKAGIGGWSDEELLRYLRTGSTPGKAQAAGPMGEAVQHSFRYLKDEDLRAIVDYLRSVPPVDDGRPKARYEYGAPANDVVKLRGTPVRQPGQAGPDPQHEGARLFLGNCASCHQWSGEGAADGFYPALMGNTVLGAQSATNLLQVILNGVSRGDEASRNAAFMPAFHDSLDDAQIASLANYLFERFGNPQVKVKAEDVARLRPR